MSSILEHENKKKFARKLTGRKSSSRADDREGRSYILNIWNGFKLTFFLRNKNGGGEKNRK